MHVISKAAGQTVYTADAGNRAMQINGADYSLSNLDLQESNHRRDSLCDSRPHTHNGGSNSVSLPPMAVGYRPSDINCYKHYYSLVGSHNNPLLDW